MVGAFEINQIMWRRLASVANVETEGVDSDASQDVTKPGVVDVKPEFLQSSRWTTENEQNKHEQANSQRYLIYYYYC